MTHEQMLQALQDDVDDWPAAVKAAGVKIASGSAYHPVARNNEVLRTPDDPQATYDYMVRAWQADDAEYAGTGWARIITQAGPELTWEWLMVDETKSYASLFPDEIRARAEGRCAQRGMTCETGVLAGEPDHRDSLLSEDERQRSESMFVCVSRSCSDRLVLDL